MSTTDPGPPVKLRLESLTHKTMLLVFDNGTLQQLRRAYTLIRGMRDYENERVLARLARAWDDERNEPALRVTQAAVPKLRTFFSWIERGTATVTYTSDALPSTALREAAGALLEALTAFTRETVVDALARIQTPST